MKLLPGRHCLRANTSFFSIRLLQYFIMEWDQHHAGPAHAASVQPQQGLGSFAEISTTQYAGTGMPGVNEVHSYYNPALLQQQPHYTNYQLLDTSQMESMEQNYFCGNTGVNRSSIGSGTSSKSSSYIDASSQGSRHNKGRPRRRQVGPNWPQCTSWQHQYISNTYI